MQPPRPPRLLAALATLGVVAATFAIPGGASAQDSDSARQQAFAAASQEFGVPVEELMGMTRLPRPAQRLSPAGLRHAERYQRLSKTEQRFVKRIIDTLLSPQPSIAASQ